MRSSIAWQEIPNDANRVLPYVFYDHSKGDVVIERQINSEDGKVQWRVSAATLQSSADIYRVMLVLPVAEGLEASSL